MVSELLVNASPVHAMVFLAVGMLFRLSRRLTLLHAVLRLPGTLAHELSHYLVGLVLGARPVSLSIRPYRTLSGRLVYGKTAFARLRWWNEVPTGLAPLLLLPIAVWAFLQSLAFAPGAWVGVLLMYLGWAFLLSSTPSFKDMTHVLTGLLVMGAIALIGLLALEWFWGWSPF